MSDHQGPVLRWLRRLVFIATIAAVVLAVVVLIKGDAWVARNVFGQHQQHDAFVSPWWGDEVARAQSSGKAWLWKTFLVVACVALLSVLAYTNRARVKAAEDAAADAFAEMREEQKSYKTIMDKGTPEEKLEFFVQQIEGAGHSPVSELFGNVEDNREVYRVLYEDLTNLKTDFDNPQLRNAGAIVDDMLSGHSVEGAANPPHILLGDALQGIVRSFRSSEDE